ncbi:MAG: putative metal-binding motif-containing protein [Candidatus Uhrbacteria bacterium]
MLKTLFLPLTIVLALTGCNASVAPASSDDNLVLVSGDMGPDNDGDGYGSVVDCDDTDVNVNPGERETVGNGIDDDCDGDIDCDDSEVPMTDYGLDDDRDGYFDDFDVDGAVDVVKMCDDTDENAAKISAMTGGSGDVANFDPIVYSGDAFSGYVLPDADCNDADATVNPLAAEVCNGIDDDCDGSIDDGADMSTYYADIDGDGFGDATMTQDACEPGPGWVLDATDCDDADANTYPMAPESCDGLDNDCDPATPIDEASLMGTWYADVDVDGYGDATMPTTACAQPVGTIDDSTDCDDADWAINPGAAELCDGIDNNCDGAFDGADSTDQTTWYRDHDGDLYGDASFSATSCNAPLSYIDTSGDCDDNAATTYPGAVELMNGIDDNCNTLVDDGAVCSIEIELFTGDAGTATIDGAVSDNAALDGNWQPMMVDGVSVSSTSLGGDDWYYDVMLSDCLGSGDDIRVDAAFSDGTWGCDSVGTPSGSLRGWQDGLPLNVAYSADDADGHCVLVVTNP